MKKLCKKCGVEKPLEEMVQHKKCKEGCENRCKQCESIGAKKYYIEHRNEIVQQQIKNSVVIALRMSKWRLENKENIRKYREKNKEKIMPQQRQWCIENKDTIVAQKKQWRLKNKKNITAYNMRYVQTEHGKTVRKLNKQRRNQRKKNLATDHDLIIHEWLNIVAYQNNFCALCNEYFFTSELTMDHIYPLKLGGLFVKENIQAVCGPCNSRKGTKTMEEFWKIYPKPNIFWELFSSKPVIQLYNYKSIIHPAFFDRLNLLEPSNP